MKNIQKISYHYIYNPILGGENFQCGEEHLCFLSKQVMDVRFKVSSKVKSQKH